MGHNSTFLRRPCLQDAFSCSLVRIDMCVLKLLSLQILKTLNQLKIAAEADKVVVGKLGPVLRVLTGQVGGIG